MKTVLLVRVVMGRSGGRCVFSSRTGSKSISTKLTIVHVKRRAVTKGVLGGGVLIPTQT